jgi:hypothetical protein
MDLHKNEWIEKPTLNDIVEVDVWSRNAIDKVLPKINSLYFINK